MLNSKTQYKKGSRHPDLEINQASVSCLKLPFLPRACINLSIEILSVVVSASNIALASFSPALP